MLEVGATSGLDSDLMKLCTRAKSIKTTRNSFRPQNVSNCHSYENLEFEMASNIWLGRKDSGKIYQKDVLKMSP